MSNSLQPHRLYNPWNSPCQNTGVGSLSLLQGIFPTQGWKPGLSHCRWILYRLSHGESPRILEWVAYLFSRGSSHPGIELGSPASQADSLPTELSGKPIIIGQLKPIKLLGDTSSSGNLSPLQCQPPPLLSRHLRCGPGALLSPWESRETA